MKKQLRSELKKLRASLENKDELSARIENLFLESDLYKKAEALLIYACAGDEVSTKRIFSKALEDNKQVAFPVCLDEKGTMDFYCVTGESDLQCGMYGIKAPAKHCKKFTGAENAVCIVPGISFDKRGYRIGYGKGYYDRFLSTFSGISIGLCYEDMLSDILPVDSFDKKTDYLITDKKIYKFY